MPEADCEDLEEKGFLVKVEDHGHAVVIIVVIALLSYGFQTVVCKDETPC